MAGRIVIACDSFKGCLNSYEVATAAGKGVKTAIPDCEIVRIAAADGGEGTARILTEALGGTTSRVLVHDPVGRPVVAEYGIAECRSERTAIMEMAQASGLTLLEPEERNPLLTSTYGTGEMILDAISKGCRKFLIGIGGSATNDGGTGMLEALGFRFTDSEGNCIEGCCGAVLRNICGIDDSQVCDEIRQSEFIIACDVSTCFCGEEGATKIFAPQKGADEESIMILEEGMQSLRSLIISFHDIDLCKVEGSGAAGGLGGAFVTFLNASLKSGTDMVLDILEFDRIIKGTDLVITGEGRIDSQSKRGKLISGVADRCRRAGVPVMAIGGRVDLGENDSEDRTYILPGFTKVYAIGPDPKNESDLKNAMLPEVAYRNISVTVARALEGLSPSLFHESPSQEQ